MNDERQQRVLDAAQRLFLKYGYDKTTVNDIAAEAGISKGAVYLHFKSKEAVMDALILREGQRVQADIMRRLAADPDGGNLFNIFRYGLIGLAENELMRAFYSRRREVFGDLLKRLAPKIADAEARSMSVEFVRQYQAAGLIRPELDPATVAFLMMVMRYGLLTIDEVVPRDESPPIEAVGALIADLLQRGLAPEGGGDPEAGKALFNTLAQGALERLKQQGRPAPDTEEGK
ncbi:MAG: TetR/AcrR family transcriptional regulator [Anaerolineae bacterium]|nr:TetR/AcrR family transcriptional regulator [Anaerolineae bacterium]